MSAGKRKQLNGRELAILSRLAKRGALTPANVVAKAATEDSLLHHRFEWDDTVAGGNFRALQARKLIASVEVAIKTNSHEVKCVAYVRDPRRPAGEQGYVDVAGTLMSDRDVARAAVEYEVARAAAYLVRVRALSIALGLESKVDKLIAGLGRFRETLKAA